MATRTELVYNIKELLRDHVDDSLISERHILFLIGTYRAKYLRQLYSKRSKAFDDSAKQCVVLEMEKADPAVCGLTTECIVLKSVQKLPNLLRVQGRSTLSYVGPAFYGTRPFELIESEDAYAYTQDKYSKVAAYIEGGYVYVIGKSPAVNLIKWIRVEGIYDTPGALEGYKSCECSPDEDSECVDDFTEYPVPGHLIADINKEVLKNYLVTMPLEDKRDITNNSVPE